MDIDLSFIKVGTFVATVGRMHTICVTHVPSPCARRVLKMLLYYVFEKTKDFVRHA